MSDIKYKAHRVMDDGEIVIVGERDGKGHGETVWCEKEHGCSKACAQELLDAKVFLVSPEETEEREGKTVVTKPAVYESVRDRIVAWFVAQDAIVQSQHVKMPKKTVQEKNDKGKLVDVQVEDRDLA